MNLVYALIQYAGRGSIDPLELKEMQIYPYIFCIRTPEFCSAPLSLNLLDQGPDSATKGLLKIC